MSGKWVAIDFDNTIFDTPNMRPMEGARDSLDELRRAGWKVMIHSCNHKSWIEKMCAEHYLQYDHVWDQPGKPVAEVYLDDRGMLFTNWLYVTEELLARREL